MPELKPISPLHLHSGLFLLRRLKRQQRKLALLLVCSQLRHHEPDGRADGHAHLGKADGHFDWHVGAALQQGDCDYGCGQVGLIVQQRHDEGVVLNDSSGVGGLQTLRQETLTYIHSASRWAPQRQ